MSIVSALGTGLTNCLHLYNNSHRIPAPARRHPPTFILLLRNQFCDLSPHLILSDLWS
jgi:hypothetical protein